MEGEAEVDPMTAVGLPIERNGFYPW